MMRSSWAVTWSVWRALFMREAMHRLYHRRAAWAWLLIEPLGQLVILIFMFTVLSVRTVGGVDTAVWITLGTLGFYLFRRSMQMGIDAIRVNKPLFVYRQVKPVDVVLVRAASESILMLVISIVIMLGAAVFGVDFWPDNWLGVFVAVSGLAFLGLAAGLLLSVPNTLISEIGDLIGLSLLPLSLMSGVMFPIARVPQPYRDWLVFNPIAHSLDALRHSFGSNYATFPECSSFYPHAVALVYFLLGLVIHRVYERRVIQL